MSETLGMHLVEFGRGEAVYEMEASEGLGNPLGVIQGGVATATALADAAMAAATTSILDDGEIQRSAITTIDIFARFIRPVNAKKIERLRAEARVIRAGGRLVWVEADVLADGVSWANSPPPGSGGVRLGRLPTEDEIREVLRQVAVYAGFPSAWNAPATMKRSLEGLSETDAEGGADS